MSRTLRHAPLGLFAVVVAVSAVPRTGPLRGGPTPQPPSADPPEGRVPWTTSRFEGSPEPLPPLAVAPAFPKLTFDRPLALAAVPGTDRLAVAQVDGKVFTFKNDPEVAETDVLIDLRRSLPELGSLFGLAFHPDYERNGLLYLCYTTGYNRPDGTHVSEFRVDRRDPPRVDPDSERLLITWYSGGHNGGCLQFGPKDGDLYISAGDGAAPTPPDPFRAGQDLSTLLSKILRIDVDARDPGLAYRVPPDNPFVDLDGARPEIWAYGFRNPWRMSFDPEGGDLWVGDVGWELWELIHRVEGGGNYGWSIVEGHQPVRPEGERGPSPIVPPVVEHPHSEAASITGGYVYRGDRLDGLQGMYIYGDYQTGTIWGLRSDGNEVTEHRVLATSPLRLVSFGTDRDGDLYLLDYEQTNQVYRLVPNPEVGRGGGDFPRTLADSGLLDDPAEGSPAPGVIPYAINAPLWEDGVTAERRMAIPGDGRIAWDPDRLWGFPEGTVLSRTTSMALDPDRPSERTRIETQVLHYQNQSWRPYSYRWSDDQTDATLVDAGGDSRTFTLKSPDPSVDGPTFTYRFAARSECMLCHNPWAGEGLLFGRQSATPLTANTLQLNVDEGPSNQLERFERLGLFESPPPGAPSDHPRLVDPYDEDRDLDARARSYLQVNCAHCHRFGAGGTASIFLTFDRPIDQMGAVGVAPSQGSFGIPEARIIAPGNPFGSTLYYRMAKLGSGRMPRVGSEHVDTEAIDLIGRWIAGLPTEGPSNPVPSPFERLRPADREAIAALRHAADPPSLDAIRTLLETTPGALALLRVIDQRKSPQTLGAVAAGIAKDVAPTEIRDLFERFVPDSERVHRLGDVVDPEVILALQGDADRGRALFFEDQTVQCRTCHRIEGQGRSLGPDLDGIGAKYSDREILEAILEPSARIEPEYRSFVLETTSGLLHSGLLVEQTDDLVILRDAQGQEIRVDPRRRRGPQPPAPILDARPAPPRPQRRGGGRPPGIPLHPPNAVGLIVSGPSGVVLLVGCSPSPISDRCSESTGCANGFWQTLWHGNAPAWPCDVQSADD